MVLLLVFWLSCGRLDSCVNGHGRAGSTDVNMRTGDTLILTEKLGVIQCFIGYARYLDSILLQHFLFILDWLLSKKCGL